MEEWLSKSDATILALLMGLLLADMLHRRYTAGASEEGAKREGWWWGWWIIASLVIRIVLALLYKLIDG